MRPPPRPRDLLADGHDKKHRTAASISVAAAKLISVRLAGLCHMTYELETGARQQWGPTTVPAGEQASTKYEVAHTAEVSSNSSMLLRRYTAGHVN